MTNAQLRAALFEAIRQCNADKLQIENFCNEVDADGDP